MVGLAFKRAAGVGALGADCDWGVEEVMPSFTYDMDLERLAGHIASGLISSDGFRLYFDPTEDGLDAWKERVAAISVDVAKRIVAEIEVSGSR